MGSTILYVDDNEDLRQVTAMLLSSAGYEVIEAESGAEALNLLEAGASADLLLTDLTMPQISGMQLAAEVRQRWPFFKVIFVTASYEAAALLSGETVVKKPYTVEELCAAITQALGNSDRSASGRKMQ